MRAVRPAPSQTALSGRHAPSSSPCVSCVLASGRAHLTRPSTPDESKRLPAPSLMSISNGALSRKRHWATARSRNRLVVISSACCRAPPAQCSWHSLVRTGIFIGPLLQGVPLLLAYAIASACKHVQLATRPIQWAPGCLVDARDECCDVGRLRMSSSWCRAELWPRIERATRHREATANRTPT